MKHSITTLLLKYKLYLLTALKPLGIWGVGIIAFVDSSSLPVPMDIVIAGYAWGDKRHAYAYAVLGALGSCLGGLVPFLLGRAGGELFLLKRVNRERFEQIRDRFERQEFLAMLIPSMLPPPTPWKAFVFGAGVFEMKIINFLAAVFLGRLIHYVLLAWLTMRYGPEMVQIVMKFAHQHLGGVLMTISILFGMVVIYYVRKNMAKRKAGSAEEAES
ncbi:MAG TPA: VTT domain-containing protein [Acidisarcina sp.]|nr:VTT domain-containing protein [Acidisarcina sp.]